MREPCKDSKDSCWTKKRITFVRSAAEGFYSKTFTYFPLYEEQHIDSVYEYANLVAALFCFVQPENAVSKVPEDSPCYSSKYTFIKNGHNHDRIMSSPLL